MHLVTIIVFCLGLSIGAYARMPRIIGGTNALLREFPFVVSIRIHANNMFICAGSIVTNWNILTSSYCLYQLNTNFDNIRVIAGINSSNDVNGEEYQIDSIIYPPEFLSASASDSIIRYDIAIIKVKSRIVFSESINKIELPTRNVFNGNLAIILGWGITSYPIGGISEKLLKTPMTIFDSDFCTRQLHTPIHRDQMCAFNKIGVGACRGDNGGPVIHDGKLAGIISVTFGCAVGVPDVHTNVYSYLPFITNNIVY